MCTEYVDPDGLGAFLACRLIPLDKNPEVRPIGICGGRAANHRKSCHGHSQRGSFGSSWTTAAVCWPRSWSGGRSPRHEGRLRRRSHRRRLVRGRIKCVQQPEQEGCASEHPVHLSCDRYHPYQLLQTSHGPVRRRVSPAVARRNHE